MSINLDLLTNYLEQLQLSHEIQRKEERIIIGFNTDNVGKLPIIICLSEEGEFLQFYAPGLLNVNDRVFKGVAFQTMAVLSYEMKLLRFEYDPTDGEVRASIELPIEDGTITFKQFQRCLLGLVQLIDDKAMPRLKAVLARGEDPGAVEPVEEVAEILAKSDPQMLNLIEKAIALHKQQNSSEL
jgi:hypothetical protein